MALPEVRLVHVKALIFDRNIHWVMYLHQFKIAPCTNQWAKKRDSSEVLKGPATELLQKGSVVERLYY